MGLLKNCSTRGMKLSRSAAGFSAGWPEALSRLFVAFNLPELKSKTASARRYLAAAANGEAISEGMTYMLHAIALGVLCEISSKRNRPDEQA